MKFADAPIAEQFTRIALNHIKRWLRGNTSTKDLGDGAKGELEDKARDLVKSFGGLFGKKDSGDEGCRGLGDEQQRDGETEQGGGSGFSRMISDKLSTGLARVHREVRLEFRKVLGLIEKQLFELLPDAFQRPLEKILGGNPFDSQLDRDSGAAGAQVDRGFGADIKVKLLEKIRGLVRKVQETLRESILGVVNGGHRKFEQESWSFVQKTVEMKVQKYLPNVKITVPADIGNEGVSVGNPAAGGLGGGNQTGHGGQEGFAAPPQQAFNPPPQQAYDAAPQQAYKPQPQQYQEPHNSQSGGCSQPYQQYQPGQYQQSSSQPYQQHHQPNQSYGSQQQHQGYQ